MKILQRFLFFVLPFLIISSCQKELNFDNIGTGISVGSLKQDGSFECFPSTVNGEYTTGSALTSDNFIDVQVNVSVTGYYNIYTDTINGYYFRGNGTLGAAGINTIRLYGSGTPELPNNPDPFIVHYDTSMCVVDVEVQPAGVDAIYTFGGAGATCTGTVLNGIYAMGTPLDATNTVQVDLQVTSPGNFSITTTQVNGVSFSASGSFSDITPTSILLTGSGTPVTSGTFNFPLLGNGTSCAFSITF